MTMKMWDGSVTNDDISNDEGGVALVNMIHLNRKSGKRRSLLKHSIPSISNAQKMLL